MDLRPQAKVLELLSNARYLVRTHAPPKVVVTYLSQAVRRRWRKRFRPAQAAFKASMSQMHLSNDWFSGNVPFWLSTFENHQLCARPRVRVLEIGSWEGLSTAFLLESLQNATLVCVDTWAGSDENQGDEALAHIEQNFDSNVSRFGFRVSKYKGTSLSYFNAPGERGDFDLIYVDGSHHCDDVVIDAVKSFERLKVGGIMIFDDYLWRLYPRAQDNPAAAINAFLRLKQGSYRILQVYWQLIIEKTADCRSSRAHAACGSAGG